MSPAEAAKSRRAEDDEQVRAGGAPSERRGKSANAFRTISEVADELAVPQHVLRFWETKFPQVKPLKRGGGRRYYRPEDVALLSEIRALLYSDGYTIRGVQKLFREGGVRPREESDDHAAEAAPAEPVETAAKVAVSGHVVTDGSGARHQLADVIAELGALRDRLARFLD
ncbi:MAG: MerR family transcriptional regulator [Rhodospirillaceae bacterium]|nr:MerR family transcriptional regulator [Rhodospirillaceae bacterium]